jgi:hypothetical protein
VGEYPVLCERCNGCSLSSRVASPAGYSSPLILLSVHNRSWDDAYEQLTYERGACNLVQKYTPQFVRDRVFAERNATLVIMVRARLHVSNSRRASQPCSLLNR